MPDNWKALLKPASFRGVGFGVFGTNTSGGRRTVTHEYPQKDTPYVEDMGRRARVYNVEGFVIGSDYMAARDALLQALERKGPGQLVHPYLGTLTLQVSDFSFDETRDEGGMASFRMVFLQTDPVRYPDTSTNQAAQTVLHASDLFDATAAMLHRQMTLLSENQGAATPAAVVTVGEVAGLIDARMKPAVSTLTDQADQYTRDLARLAADAQALVTAPADLAYRVMAILSRLSVAADPFRALSVYKRLFDDLMAYFGAKSYGQTAVGQLSARNDALMEQSFGFAVAGTAAQLAVSAAYTTRRQAEDTRDMVAGMLSDLLPLIEDDSVYGSASALRTAVLQAIPPEGEALKDEVAVTIIAPVPSLVLAYNVYGSLDSEADVIARNDIRNPFCIQAGTVQVLQ